MICFLQKKNTNLKASDRLIIHRLLTMKIEINLIFFKNVLNKLLYRIVEFDK